MTRLRALVTRLDTTLAGLRGQLTEGQRWTLALGLALTLAILLFGIPDRVVAGR